MVYEGKPSQGCRTCRKRKIRCDEGKPTCQRCAKSKRECGGYRSQFDVIHRDETQSTARRLRRPDQKTPSRQPTALTPISVTFVKEYPPCEPASGSICLNPQRRQLLEPLEPPEPQYPLLVPSIDQAACYFVSNFVLLPAVGNARGYLEFVYPLIMSESPNSSLRHAFNACAFASLGNRYHGERSDLADEALAEYGKALNLARTSLDTKSPRTDALLAAILLMGLFEYITARKEKATLDWRSHIEGAVSILKSRGRDLLKTKLGMLLFTAVRAQLVVRTLSGGVPAAVSVDWWMSGTFRQESLTDSAHRFCLKTAEFHPEVARIMAGYDRSVDAIELLIQLQRRCQTLDQDISTWMQSIPTAGQPKMLCWIWEDDIKFAPGEGYADVEVFPGKVDLYPDFMTAHAYNMARAARLVLQAITIRLAAARCSPRDHRETPEFKTAKNVCEGLIAEIMASIPYHLGWHMRRLDLFYDRPDLLGFACGDEAAPLKALPGMFAMWPLVAAKNHDMTSEDQREWIRGRLRFIADMMGLKFAHILERVELRYPSMMIKTDGTMVFPDPFVNAEGSKLPLRIMTPTKGEYPTYRDVPITELSV